MKSENAKNIANMIVNSIETQLTETTDAFGDTWFEVNHLRFKTFKEANKYKIKCEQLALKLEINRLLALKEYV